MPIRKQDAVQQRHVVGGEARVDRRKVTAQVKNQPRVDHPRAREHRLHVLRRVGLLQVVGEVINAPRHKIGVFEAELGELDRQRL